MVDPAALAAIDELSLTLLLLLTTPLLIDPYLLFDLASFLFSNE
jgi:hypothetical protein